MKRKPTESDPEITEIIRNKTLKVTITNIFSIFKKVEKNMNMLKKKKDTKDIKNT